MPILMRGDKVRWQEAGVQLEGWIEKCDKPQEGFCIIRAEAGRLLDVPTSKLTLIEEADNRGCVKTASAKRRENDQAK